MNKISKKFKFPLETLLKVRVKQEDESKMLFAKAKKEKEVVLNKLNSLNDSYKKHNNISKVENIVSQKIKRNYLIGLSEKISMCERELCTKEKELELRRSDLSKKTINKKVVETLKENYFEEYKKDINKSEQIQNDEFSITSYLKSKKGGDDNK